MKFPCTAYPRDPHGDPIRIIARGPYRPSGAGSKFLPIIDAVTLEDGSWIPIEELSRNYTFEDQTNEPETNGHN